MIIVIVIVIVILVIVIVIIVIVIVIVICAPRSRAVLRSPKTSRTANFQTKNL